MAVPVSPPPVEAGRVAGPSADPRGRETAGVTDPAFVQDPGYPGGDTSWRDPGFPQTDRDPVVNVSATDATAYAAWLSRKTGKAYRLPSEAEWEYAARAGATTARFWGDDRDRTAACGYANVADETLRENFFAQPDRDRFFACDDSYAATSPVGKFHRNGFGLYDMLGNVWQWTADCYSNGYSGAPSDGSAWTTGDCDRRVLRGGSWAAIPRFLRAGTRSRIGTDKRGNDAGFRLARIL
jgi:formylglycine-generating enzyme required for sulfatase activity